VSFIVTSAGLYPGDVCNRRGCDGILAEAPRKDCYCHLSAPCHWCVEDRTFCPECGWAALDE
jgi:hypothetical protein